MQRCGYWPCGWCRSKDRCDQAKESRNVCRAIWWVIGLEVAGVVALMAVSFFNGR